MKIGVVGATDPQWVEFKKQAEKQNLYVDIVDLGLHFRESGRRLR